ncbi:MAG: hypothetical protein ACD_36C00036G0005 [uncultured bacterium]|nr:MAG: hypothetical protein ACD_36C00036G0005 [uncultured bacterium]
MTSRRLLVGGGDSGEQSGGLRREFFAGGELPAGKGKVCVL